MRSEEKIEWWKRPVLQVAVLALITSGIGVLNDFVYDDVPIILENVRLHSLQNFSAIVTKPWWPPPFVEQLYRPFAALLLAIQWAIGGGSAAPFRVFSIALYVVSSVLFFRLATRLFPSRTALALAAVFAVHPVHVEAVALAVNQGEIIASICAMLMLIAYIDGRRAGPLPLRTWLVIALCYAVAVLSKESAFVLPGFLIAAELLLFSDGPALDRASTTIGAGVISTVAAMTLGLRQMALGSGVFNVVPVAQLQGLDLGGRAFAMLQIVPEWLRLLTFPARLRADFSAYDFQPPAAIGTPEALGIAILVGAAALIWTARRRAPVLAFGLAVCAIALLPVSNLVPTGIMLAERTLFTPSIGFLVAVAASAHWLAASVKSPATTKGYLAWGCVVLIVVGAIKSANRSSLWNSAHVVVQRNSLLIDR
jgi:hypothetical protein